jgi:hypothetical protein
MSAVDRLELIEQKRGRVTRDDIKWLIAEVRNLRVPGFPARVTRKLIELGVVRVTVYPDMVEISGGEDSDDVLFQIHRARPGKPGERDYDRAEVAAMFSVRPSEIEESDLLGPESSAPRSAAKRPGALDSGDDPEPE